MQNPLPLLRTCAVLGRAAIGGEGPRYARTRIEGKLSPKGKSLYTRVRVICNCGPESGRFLYTRVRVQREETFFKADPLYTRTRIKRFRAGTGPAPLYTRTRTKGNFLAKAGPSIHTLAYIGIAARNRAASLLRVREKYVKPTFPKGGKTRRREFTRASVFHVRASADVKNYLLVQKLFLIKKQIRISFNFNPFGVEVEIYTNLSSLLGTQICYRVGFALVLNKFVHGGWGVWGEGGFGRRFGSETIRQLRSAVNSTPSKKLGIATPEIVNCETGNSEIEKSGIENPAIEKSTIANWGSANWKPGVEKTFSVRRPRPERSRRAA